MPPSRKYQSDGGPNSRQALDLLKGSDVPKEDRTFLKAQIFFWLIAATDGHTKNFTIRLSPGGQFRLTPLYDILSMQPSFDAGQIQKKQRQLAMSVGKNRHYAMKRIQPRHFEQDADAAGMPEGTTQSVFAELREVGPAAIAAARAAVKDTVPDILMASIEAALRGRLEQLD